METKQSRNWALRGSAILIAGVIVLFAFSGTTGPTPGAQASVQELETRTYVDPSLAGLSVAADADPGGDVEMYY